MPAKCVSPHAETVHWFSYIIYSPQLGVIPQGRQAREQYPEADSFELSLMSSNADCISMVSCYIRVCLCVNPIYLVYTRDIKQKEVDVIFLSPFKWVALEDLFSSICLFIYLWLCWVFVSVRGLSLVAASGGHSSSRRAGLSLSRPLLLRSTGSRRAGSVIVAHGPSCSMARGIFPDQGSNPCPLHWQADSQPLRHQGSSGSVLK